MGQLANNGGVDAGLVLLAFLGAASLIEILIAWAMRDRGADGRKG